MASHGPPPAPPINAYWFYSSPFPLDDPLAPFPIPTAATAAIKYPPRPFARYDSLALETAYQDLLSQRAEYDSPARSSVPKVVRRGTDESATTIREVAKEGQVVLKEGDSDAAVELTDEIGVEIPDKPVRKSSSSFLSTTPPLGTSPGGGGLGTSPNTRSGTTRTPFIRSLTQSRASTMPSRSSSLSSRKPTPPPPSPPVQTEIPVGIQRLHQVLLPSFVMTPIYWSPLQDVASVMRGTWFYGDTMLPVEAETANRLEVGWEEVRAWTEEWEMELASAVEVGREGEEKVRWQLWAKETGSRPGSALGGEMGGFDTEGGVKQGVTGGADTPRGGQRADAADWVLFANRTDAYICRDTMLSFGNKRPLANIRKGKVIGTHVVRGFQQDVWERLYPSAKKRKVPASGAATAGRRRNAPSTPDPREKRGYGHIRAPTGASPGSGTTSSGPAREEMAGLGPDDEERIPVTDLFLVIHGIGQKLSERVESFHFTHAINSFRRHVNVELKDPAVRPHLRDGGKVGMMVLPVNWRHNLSFEEGVTASTPAPNQNDFTLTDITPPSIPAVRNLIGDVMLDIPYYLSHHKQKMIRAVVKEANRVWRLWCLNNPGFEKRGRVHIIAHSLGTAIAMDILSQQPTRLQREEGLTVGSSGWKKTAKDLGAAEDRFEFDTKNVFFVGSPAGFFLLLNKSTPPLPFFIPVPY